MPRKDIYAHSLEGRPKAEWQGLREHLEGVADLAGEFAAAFESADWGRLAGLWHDLGKVRRQFQDYIDPASRETAGGDHAVGGALLAWQAEALSSQKVPLALVIAGHHAGLANLQADEVGSPRPLMRRLEEAPEQMSELRSPVLADLAGQPLPALPPFLGVQPTTVDEQVKLARRSELWTRFVFSALVDADRLDTQRFYDPGDAQARGRGFCDLENLGRRLDAHIDQLAAKARPTAVNRLRQEILHDCREAAKLPPGLFSLTVPTGGGKTLSALSFALRHAGEHGLRRVISAIPYTSIIEQTAGVYRDALNRSGEADQVVEHHSNLDPEEEKKRGEESLRRRWAAENWDAPMIVTTNVQLFESLFSNRPSRCRKLHNVAGSILILDEAQSLPAHLLLPILEGLEALVEDYGCTVLFCTATQPALNRRQDFAAGLPGVREIVADPSALALSLRRFQAELPAPDAPPSPWEDLARRIVRHPQVLAIVHRRQDAQDLARLLEGDGDEIPLFHLSALMCAAHRQEILGQVRERLAKDFPCRLVSTQLVEAGVDIDFPVVFRALGGLDSLVQAAGRCNREGRQREGCFFVFRAPTPPPPGILTRGFEEMESLLRELGTDLDLTAPDLVARYFRRLYRGTDLDSKKIQAQRGQLNFHTVARRFRLIEDGYSEPVAVPWGEGPARLERLRREGPTTDNLRALQPFLVQVPRYRLAALADLGSLDHVADTVYALSLPFHHLYKETYGLLLDDSAAPDPKAWIV